MKGRQRTPVKPATPHGLGWAELIVVLLVAGGGFGTGYGMRVTSTTFTTTFPDSKWEQAEAKSAAKAQAEADKKTNAWAHRVVLHAPKDAPPALIKVGPFFYSVHYTNEKTLGSQNALALTDLERREIWLNPAQTASLRENLLHELLHCARDLGTGGNRFIGQYDKDENDIEAITTGLLQIIQDNAALRTWLAKQ